MGRFASTFPTRPRTAVESGSLLHRLENVLLASGLGQPVVPQPFAKRHVGKKGEHHDHDQDGKVVGLAQDQRQVVPTAWRLNALPHRTHTCYTHCTYSLAVSL